MKNQNIKNNIQQFLKPNFLKAYLLLGLSLALIGCGSSKVSSGESVLASTTPNTTSSTTVIQGKNYGLANCSESASNSDFKVRLTGMSNRVMRLQILSMPDSFRTNGSYLVVSKSAVDSNGNKTDDPTNLSYNFEIKNNSGTIEGLANGYTYTMFDYKMTQTMMKYAMCDTNLISKKYFSDVATTYLTDFYSNTTLSCNNSSSSDAKNNQIVTKYFNVFNVTNRFFNSVDLLVDTKDSTNSYQILTVRLVSEDGRSEFASTQVLIPQFVADPNVYQSTHSDTLFQLHPLKDKLGQNWSDSQYVGFTSSLCYY